MTVAAMKQLIDMMTWKLDRKSVASNKVTSTITPPNSDYKVEVGFVRLGGTAGTGGSESITVKSDATELDSDSFTVGTDKSMSWNSSPLPADAGDDMVVQASATNLTAGYLCVVYRITPA